jgi:hypothetical protein
MIRLDDGVQDSSMKDRISASTTTAGGYDE